MTCLPPLEHNQVSVTRPADVWVVWGLLDVLAGEGIRSFVLVAGVHLIQALDARVKLLLVEHSEHGEDALLHQEVQGRLPELEHAVRVEARVNSHRDVGNLHLLCPDPPEKYILLQHKVQRSNKCLCLYSIHFLKVI